MPAAISETIKPKVISQWLLGLRRDIIAQDNNISAGAVSNIINNWSIALGKPEADALRGVSKSIEFCWSYSGSMCNWLSNYDIATRAEHRCRCGCTIDRRYIQKM